MNIEIAETVTKQIINGMTKNYGYHIEDFSFMKGNCIHWGLTRPPYDGDKRILVFTDLEQEGLNETSENYICSKFDCNRENIIKVILISEERDIAYMEERLNYFKSVDSFQNNFITINLPRKQVEISNDNMEEVQYQILNSINNSGGNVETGRIDIKSEVKAAPVTFGLIAVNILMFVICGILSSDFTNINTDVLVSLGAKYNPAIDNGQWFRLITCMFLHGGIIHILSNMYSLYCVGPTIEKIYGKYKFILMYFFSGIIGSLFSFFFSPYAVSVGASGAIMGLVGVLFVFAIKERKRVGKGLLINIGVVLCITIFVGLSRTGIDNFAHLGGFLSGAAFTVIVSLTQKK